MDKLEMAHDYAKIILSAMLDGKLEYKEPHEIANEAFAVLDAMLVENGGREVITPVYKEWQPDWSQAPKDTIEWKMVGIDHAVWVSDHGDETYLEDAPSFNYQGNWQDSLRKRPQ